MEPARQISDAAPASLRTTWEQVWARADGLFRAVRHEGLLARPLPGEAPLIYFLGAGAARAWRALVRPAVQGAHGRPELEARFDLDAGGRDPTPGERAPAHHWPRPEALLAWRAEVADAVAALLDGAPDDGGPLACAARRCMEDELLAQERVLAMVQQLPEAFRPQVSDPRAASLEPGGHGRRVRVPAGEVWLGVDARACPWAREHEQPARRVAVRAFKIDALPVRQGEYLEFVEAGGYADPTLWERPDGLWRARHALAHPASWRRVGGSWRWVGPFQSHPLTRVFDWPVSVSLAEARAYARWRGARLPTEAEWLRAAHGTLDGGWRAQPWGGAALDPGRARYGQPLLGPAPAGSRPAGASAFGVQETVGNGWEWVDDPARPSRALEQGGVLRGLSWVSDALLLRPGLRRRASAHDPWGFTKFRLVWPD